jgi:anti-anti-sigma regulatory factor
MSATALFLKIEEERIVPVLQDAAASLDRAESEVVLDFASVRRIDSGAVQALEDFARVADEKAVNIVLCGVNVDVYKVLKLMKLMGRISFRH